MSTTLAMLNNPTGLMILVAVLVLFFGGSKIPELMKGVGTGIKEFKKGLNEVETDEVHLTDTTADTIRDFSEKA